MLHFLQKWQKILQISGNELFAIQEDVQKNSILLYDTEKPEEVRALIANVTNQCQCEVEHLRDIQALLLHYPTASHDPATNFLQISGIVMATEDNVVFPPSDELNVIQNFSVSRLESKVRVSTKGLNRPLSGRCDSG